MGCIWVVLLYGPNTRRPIRSVTRSYSEGQRAQLSTFGVQGQAQRRTPVNIVGVYYSRLLDAA